MEQAASPSTFAERSLRTALRTCRPNRIDEEAWTLELTLPLDGKTPRTVRVLEGRKGYATISALSGGAIPASLRTAVAYVLRLDEDLSPFYEAAATDPELAWVTTGAGRMIRSPTVFEEVVKTICNAATRSRLAGLRPPRARLEVRAGLPA